MARLADQIILNIIQNYEGWIYEDKSILKEFPHKDFISALGFVLKVGVEAEKLDHHPDILIHSWNKVRITISTHSEGGVTEKDFALADKIEKLELD